MYIWNSSSLTPKNHLNQTWLESFLEGFLPNAFFCVDKKEKEKEFHPKILPLKSKVK